MAFRGTRNITKEDLRRYSSEILKFFEMEKIASFEQLEGKIGTSFNSLEGRIYLEMRPSKKMSVAYTVSYVIHGKGIPIEIRLNKIYGYSNITIKSEEVMTEYKPQFSDPLGNIIQDKKFEFSFDKVLQELKKLTEKNDPEF